MELHLHYEISSDFDNAGEASGNLKKKLMQLGVPVEAIKRTSIAMYEAEMNAVIHAKGGYADVHINNERVKIKIVDNGPGINDVALAMKEGYSTAPDEIRQLGFGAGMGLPNIKKNTDFLDIETKINNGTTLTFEVVYKKP